MTETARRVVLAVSGDLRQAEVAEVLFACSSYSDVVVVESLTCAYAHVKRLLPDAVLVYMTIDDAAAYRLLSMLATDDDVSWIPVVPLIANEEWAAPVDVTEFNVYSPRVRTGIPMN